MVTRYTQRNLVWVDLINPSASEVRQVMHEFELDPLIAEELLVPSFKPKVERRGDAIYVILHFPTPRLSGRTEQEIDFIIGKHYLITTRYEEIDPLHTFAKAFEVNAVLGRNSSSHGGHLFAAMARELYTGLLGECDLIRRQLQQIEERIFNGEERRMVISLSHAGRTIYDFKQSLLPHQEMLYSLEPVGGRFFGQEYAYWVREIIGTYERVQKMLGALHDSLAELRATNDSLLSTKQNDIMKTLTVLTFTFLPLTFIASLFAMDTVHNPIVGNPLDFWIIVGGMAFIGLCCIVYFKRKGWL